MTREEGETDTMSEDRQRGNDWYSPATIFGVINLIALAVLALNFYYGQSGQLRDRVVRIETKLEYHVLPSLQRIETTLSTQGSSRQTVR